MAEIRPCSAEDCRARIWQVKMSQENAFELAQFEESRWKTRPPMNKLIFLQTAFKLQTRKETESNLIGEFAWNVPIWHSHTQNLIVSCCLFCCILTLCGASLLFFFSYFFLFSFGRRMYIFAPFPPLCIWKLNTLKELFIVSQ